MSHHPHSACDSVRTASKLHQNVSLLTLAQLHQKKVRLSTGKNIRCLLVHLSRFHGEGLMLHEVDSQFCIDFSDYLIRQVRTNSARTYLQALHALLHTAVRQGYILCNPMPPISDLVPRHKTVERAYLTIEELRLLESASCPHLSTKQAFLFACHTGLRLSDIETLAWDDIIHKDGRFLISKLQVKTGREVRIPLDLNAEKILMEVRQQNLSNPGGRVFQLYSRVTIGKDLASWAREAGIEKHITFHVARHSFATNLISHDVDIYTVSQLCGHTNIQTTLIYVRLLDTARINAIIKMDHIYGIPPRRAHEAHHRPSR